MLNCDRCGENVGREDKLRSHLKKRLCSAKFPCSSCPLKFTSAAFLRDHVKDYHKK